MSEGGSSTLNLGSFAVKLDFFSGPMDLLLHLVRQQEVSIEQVDMTEVCQQYLQIVINSAELDLDRASEYLVIAATLLSIKSQAMLPQLEIEDDNESFENPEDALTFYEELRRRLLAYEETKQIAAKLVQTPQLGVDVFRRKDKAALLPDPEDLGEGEDPFSLGAAFARLLKRIGETVNSMKIRLEPVSIVSFMVKIVDYLGVAEGNGALKGRQSFKSLIRSFINPAIIRRDAANEQESHARTVVIGSFIAVLELMKRGLIVANQDSNGEIEIAAREEQLGERNKERTQFLASVSSEFDQVATTEDKVVAMDDYRDAKSYEVLEDNETQERKEANRG